MMRRLVRFTIAAVVFEAVALAISLSLRITWLLQLLVALLVLYFLLIAVRGWRKSVGRRLPEVMTGRVVRRRHWHLF